MSKLLKLGQVAKYSEERVDLDNVSLENFITVDNMLPNKGGITIAENLPPKGSTLPEYKQGNILVGNIRPYLKKIWFADKAGGAAADVLIFNVNQKYNPKFVYYAMFRDDFFDHMMRGKKGTKMPRGDKRHILDFLIPNFEYPIQQRIASVLSSLDAKIELNNRINVELEAMAKMLYDYWFVQFNFPDENGIPYKSSGGRMVLKEELKREIPEEWEVKRLGKVLDTVLGGTPPTENKSFWENGIFNWLNSGEVADFPIVNSEKKITEEAIHESATELLPKGTTLLSITRHLRPTILAIDACANQSVVGIKEKGDIKHNYIYPYLKNEIPRYLSLRTGGQQPHINKETVDESFILLPQKNSRILNNYNKLTEPIYSQIICNAFQNKRLRDLRNWLLPTLMNGQVKVNKMA